MASNGYVNKGEVKEVTVVPNQTIEVTFGNKAQQGLLKLKKTGKQVSTVTIEESEYGTLNHFTFEDLPLAGATFEIKATKDIVQIVMGELTIRVMVLEHGHNKIQTVVLPLATVIKR